MTSVVEMHTEVVLEGMEKVCQQQQQQRNSTLGKDINKIKSWRRRHCGCPFDYLP